MLKQNTSDKIAHRSLQDANSTPQRLKVMWDILLAAVLRAKSSIYYLLTISSSTSSKLIGLDFLTMDVVSGTYQYLLVQRDHFSRFAQVYANTSSFAKTAVDCFNNNFKLKHGIPGKISQDQGKEFKNDLSQTCDIKCLRTTLCHL